MAVIHFYRGEVARANTWRLRLDQTTNWALFVTATGLGFAFGDAEASHFSLQFANLMLLILLSLEARRFRFFDVWRTRIRKIEVNFFAPILERQLVSPEDDWALLVADDLAQPHFHVTRVQALRMRLLRNYWAIFAIVFLAWVIKLVIHPVPAVSIAEVYARCDLGPVPGSVVLIAVGCFYAALTAIVLLGRSRRPPGGWDIGEIVAEET